VILVSDIILIPVCVATQILPMRSSSKSETTLLVNVLFSDPSSYTITTPSGDNLAKPLDVPIQIFPRRSSINLALHDELKSVEKTDLKRWKRPVVLSNKSIPPDNNPTQKRALES